MSTTPNFETWIAITELKARYCRLLDTKDWDSYAALLTEDFELDISEGTGIPVIRGCEVAVKQVLASVGGSKTAHQVHAPEIRVTGSDEAEGVWAMQDHIVWEAERAARMGISGLSGYGHYHERYRRQNGVWKIAALRLTRLHVDMQRVATP